MQAIQGARDLARSVRNRNYSEIENLVRDATSNHNIGPDEDQCRKILNVLLNAPPGGYVYQSMFTMLWKRIVDIKYQLHVLKGLLLLSYLLKNKTVASQLVPDVKQHIHDIKVLMNYELGKGNLQGQNVRDEAGDIYFFIMNGLWKTEHKALEEKKRKEAEDEEAKKRAEKPKEKEKKPKKEKKRDDPKPASLPQNAQEVFGEDFFDSFQQPPPPQPKPEPRFDIPQVDLLSFANEFADMDQTLRPPSPPKPVVPAGPSEEELARRRKAEEDERNRLEALRRQQDEAKRKAEEEEAKKRARAEKWRKEREDKERADREAREKSDKDRLAQEAIDRERRAKLEAEERERRSKLEAEERERLARAREQREKEEREAKERAEREARERAEREAREKAEREAREKAEREAAEAARLKAEQEERDRLAREEAERLAREARERAEAEERERLRREQEERDRLAREEAERLRKEQEERDRLARLEAERLKREQEERDRLAREEAERLRKEQEALAERLRKEQEERDRLAREEAERLRKEQEERDRLAREEAERLRREQEERDRLAREEAERLRKEQEERDRLRREEEERLRKEQEERDRLAREEAERLRREQEERDRLAREEAERLKREQDERDRLAREEAERLRKEQEEKERKEREEAERLEREERERLEREEAERRRKADYRNRPAKELNEDVRAELICYGAHVTMVLNPDDPNNLALKPVMPVLVGEGIGAPAGKIGTDLLKKVEDGLILSHYVNLIVPDTVDTRVLNVGDDITEEDNLENVNLMINAAKSIGIRTQITAQQVVRANQDQAHQRPVTDAIWALIKVYLLNDVTLTRHPDLRECAASKEEAEQMDRLTSEQLLMCWFQYQSNQALIAFTKGGAHPMDVPQSHFESNHVESTIYTYITILTWLLSKMKIQGGAQQRRASKTEEDLKPITDSASLWKRFVSLSNTVNVRWSASVSSEALLASNTRIQLAYMASLFNRFIEIDEAAWEQERRDKDRKRKLKEFNDQWHGGEETSFRMWINSLGLSLTVEGETGGGKGLSAGGNRRVSVAAHVDTEAKRRAGARSSDVFVNNLFEDCKDGLVLLPVLDHVSKESVKWKQVEIPPQLEIKAMGASESKNSNKPAGNIISPFSTSKLSRLKAVNNNNYVVEIAQNLGLSVVNVGGVDIADGTQKIVLAITWQLMRYHIVQFLKSLYAKALASGKITADFATSAEAKETSTTPASKAKANRRASALMSAPAVVAMDMSQFEKDSDFDNLLISWANKCVLRARKNPNKGLQLFAASLSGPAPTPTSSSSSSSDKSFLATPTAASANLSSPSASASADADLTRAGTGRVMKNFNDPSLADSLFLLELLAAISIRVVNWKLVKKPHFGANLPASPSSSSSSAPPTPGANVMLSCGLTKQEAILNARYVVSAARKLGCTIFLSPDDIVQVKPKMILTMIASIMAVTLT